MTNNTTVFDPTPPDPTTNICILCEKKIKPEEMEKPGIICVKCKRPTCSACRKLIRDAELEGCSFCNTLDLDPRNENIKKALEEIKQRKLNLKKVPLWEESPNEFIRDLGIEAYPHQQRIISDTETNLTTESSLTGNWSTSCSTTTPISSPFVDMGGKWVIRDKSNPKEVLIVDRPENILDRKGGFPIDYERPNLQVMNALVDAHDKSIISRLGLSTGKSKPLLGDYVVLDDDGIPNVLKAKSNDDIVGVSSEESLKDIEWGSDKPMVIDVTKSKKLRKPHRRNRK